MRKNLITALLLTIAFTLPIAAADAPSAAFTVSASVSAISDMRITNIQVNEETFGDSGNIFSGSVAIVGSGDGQNMDGAGNVTFSAYISAISNNPAGYTIEMSATPLTSAGTPPATINYIVSVIDAATSTADSYDTKSDSAAVEVITAESLSALGVESLPISVQVYRSEFDSAVQGTYTGTVTFNYVSGA